MDLMELLRILWQRKLVALLVLAATIALGLASLALQTPIYRATSTVALTPQEGAEDPIFIISQIDVITPLYAEAAETRETLELARRIDGREDIGDVSVRTFRGAPILKIDSESPDPSTARRGAQAVTEAVIQRVDRGDIGLSDTLRVSQIDRPQTPEDAVRPQPRLTIAVAILLGLGFGVVASVAWDRLGRKIETAEELGDATGTQVYGEIPLDRSVPSVTSPLAIVHDDRLRVVAEALRDVRTNLQFTEGALRSVLVTSPEGSHGKTVTSLGLAATLARAGARTLLLDGDLRRGRVAELLGVRRSPGVMEVLTGTAVSRAIQPTDLDGLSVLTGGTLGQDPGELLESSFFQLLYDLEAAYDLVVVDGTPLLPINDARIISRYTGGVLVVTAAGTVTRRQARAAIERLAIIGVTPTATILNQSRRRYRSSYYRYLRTPAESPQG